MSDTRIIIAEQDPALRSRLARLLAEAADAVTTTASAARLMRDLLRGGRPVVVLGETLEEGLPVAALVGLLKRCNPRATIILVADEVAPVEERRVRQQGIFYRANRPLCALGCDELQRAVTCACSH